MHLLNHMLQVSKCSARSILPLQLLLIRELVLQLKKIRSLLIESVCVLRKGVFCINKVKSQIMKNLNSF